MAQEQLNDPGLLLHVAEFRQPPLPEAHSSTSSQLTPSPFNV